MSIVSKQEGMTDLLPCNERSGADYAKYSFSQSKDEVVITVPLPPGTTRKQLSVNISTNDIVIIIKEKAGENCVLKGKLYRSVKSDECMWCIEDQKDLVLTLVKSNSSVVEEWWPHIVLGERQIDMKTFRPPPVHISELDEGAQATVSRMMFDQRQKQAGLPTSEELKLEELVRRQG